MSRTDFAHNFSLLPGNIKPTFEAEGGDKKFADLVLRVAGRTNGGDERVYPKTVAQGLASKRIVTTIMLTRRNWLENIPRNIDLLRHAKLENKAYDGQEAVHKSLGSLEPNQLSLEEKNMIVVELRGMTQGRTAEELRPLAMAAFKLIQQLNQGKELRYKK